MALEKVCLITTILNCRERNNYARELLEEELFHGWPGITKEVQNICTEMGLPDATRQYVSRAQAKEEIENHNHRTVKKEMEGKSKCDQIYKKDLRKRQVFMNDKSLENARIEILWLTNMIDTRTSMKGKYKKYNCPHCIEGIDEGVLESPQHLMHCGAYLDMRSGINPELDQLDRPGYLRRVPSRTVLHLGNMSAHGREERRSLHQ